MPQSRPAPSTLELEQIRYALDQSAIVAITDVPGKIKYVNDKFCEISKYDRSELIGQDHRILNSGYHSKDFMRGLWRTIAQGHVWRGELRNRAKDGSLYWVDTTIVPFLDDQGKPWQYMAIRYDITQRKLQEQRLRDQAALTSIGEMAAVVAHEVRNPLAGIRGGVQLLSTLFPDATEGRELIDSIVVRIDSLNAVLSDLLTFARVRELKPTGLEMRAFLEDLSASLKLDPAMRGVQIVMAEVPDETVVVDVDQFRLVLMNLLLNAAQAMNNTGRIVVTARTTADELELTVTDAGPGIPAEVRDRIFEPFFTTKHRGTGLGLPTAKRIVEAHGGELSIESHPPGGPTGTVVQIRLPRRPALA
ncbi:MAG: PAS domain S-box protein [Acidobacteria bacterium]|nr:MAG: PAS domain S-box protein [Acidobacteriota bacterium]